MYNDTISLYWMLPADACIADTGWTDGNSDIQPDVGTMSSGISPQCAPGNPEESHSNEEEEGMFEQLILRKPRNGSAVREIPFTFSQKSYPLNPSATLTFTLDEQQEITLVIFDSFGRVIHTLYEKALVSVGYHELKLYGGAFPAGGCYARLETKFGVQQRTLILNISKSWEKEASDTAIEDWSSPGHILRTDCGEINVIQTGETTPLAAG